MDGFYILPAEIIWDILARLPTESVIEFKLVSKIWRNLIQHPSFYKMHFNRHCDSGKLGFLALSGNTKQIYYFDYIENHETPIDRIRRMNITLPFKDKYTYIGSINGLLCIRDVHYKDRHNSIRYNHIYICNLMTKEYVILPQPEIDFRQYSYWSSGFGYLPSTNEYKVVALYKDLNSVIFTVYTLGSGNGWRNLEKLDSKVYSVPGRSGVFLNGALYWGNFGRGIIAVFDLANETFGEQVTPDWRVYGCGKYTIGVLGGYLFYAKKQFYYNPDRQTYFDIWLFKERTIDNHDMQDHQEPYQSLGWIKEFRHPNRKLLALTESGGILSYSSNNLNIYDPKASTSRPLTAFKEGITKVFPHKNTLLSLKELGEEDIRIME